MTKFEDELRDDMEYGRNNITPGSRYYSLLEAANLLLEILPEMREMVGWRKNGSQDLYSCESGASGYYKICDGGGSYISGDFVYDNDAEMFVYLANATTTLTEKLKKAGVV